ncbi:MULTISPECIES: hypothetical protein [Streptomyces]|uniref:hypothetical protein n=1 Tax=Streptomyces TaxID=1883 RepID=UPI0022499A48|nr:hypothetical protein [Streptomyces sp. JHD 1]MCX2969764.1 hypothetical protein [Streptomyces sp. JHD 1]
MFGKRRPSGTSGTSGTSRASGTSGTSRVLRGGVLAAALALAAGTAPASAAPAAPAAPAASTASVGAQADSIGDCPYPYVCLYDVSSGRKVSQFRDVTSGYQPVASNRYDVVNTRYDDVAYFRHFDTYVCIAPRARTSLPSVNGIRISWEATCR